MLSLRQGQEIPHFFWGTPEKGAAIRAKLAKGLGVSLERLTAGSDRATRKGSGRPRKVR
jgi:hypothetical protein